MASQSSLRMRVATIRELLAPDTSKRPCVTVRINRDPPPPQGPLLLTAGEAPTDEIQSPAEPAEVHKRSAGHVCGPHCVRVSITFAPRRGAAVSEGTRGDSAAPVLALPAPEGVAAENGNARTEPGRGDVQPGQGRAAVGRDVEPQPGPPRRQAPAAAPGGGRVDVPARDAVVEMMERTAPPALVSPLAVQMRREANAAARALTEDVQLLVPWWLPVAPYQLADCAVPWCHHEAAEHRSVRLRLPCRHCRFQADQHHPDGLALEVPQYARKVSPCHNYRAIYVDEDDSDRCEHPGCTCRAYCRWLPPDPSDPRTAIDVRAVEMARALAETREQLARLQAEVEAAQREALRAQGRNDLGPDPHDCPVYSDEVNR